MRKDVEKVTGRKLDFLKLIRPEGEAHLTVFTPVEAQAIVARTEGEPGKVTMSEIEELTKKVQLKDMDLTTQGIGSGSKMIDGKLEETFFLLVESDKLKELRGSIKDLFVSKGGDPQLFSPETFYPHITIGYTKRELHVSDGVIKDYDNSFDSRFKVSMDSSKSASVKPSAR